METLQIKKDDAIKAHDNATIKGKVLLENLFGKKTFLKNVKERIKSLQDAINELGEKDVDVIDYRSLLKANVSRHIIAQQEAIIITKALNEGWVPDWNNGQYDKYFAWFDMRGSSGFRYGDCGDWHTNSDVGSRLCFRSSELAKYAGENFTEIYKDFMTIQ